jgi:glycosyltransferase involved in cell wall biosynthesis
MEKRKLSVYVLTYNEEAKIRDCLESVTWADEIVVLDSFSTDRTVQICQNYTDRIIQSEFSGFGKLRNFAVEQCSNEWILSVDADERVTPELRDEIQSKLAGVLDADAYFIPRKSHFLKYWVRHCGWYPDYRQPQLFHRGRLKYREQLVHEGYDIEGKAGRLREHIIQFPFLSLDQFLKKIDRYTTLRAQDMARAGVKFHIWQILTHPAAMFWRMYFQKLGFLDGRIGLLLSVLYSYYTMLKYAKLWEISKVPSSGD